MSAAAIGAGKPASEDTRVRGPWLVVARGVWATLAALIVAFFLANLPVYVVQMRTTCRRQPCAPWQLTAASTQAIQQIHLTLTSYAIVSLVFSVACVLMWFAIAGIIVWRQSRHWLGLLTSLLLMAQGVTVMGGGFLAPLEFSAPAWYPVTLGVGLLPFALFPLIFSLFPNGRFVPSWMRWAVVVLEVVVVWVYVMVAPMVASTKVSLNPLAIGLFIGVFFGIVGAQIYRYRRVSTPVERQQTKLVVLGVAAGPFTGPLYLGLPILFPALSQPNSLYFVVARPIYSIVWLWVPIWFGIALLRYHLWDVDVIIRRTLIYGSLTAILGAVYFGCVIGAQALAQALTGVASLPPVVIVASTLLIAALFTPLRRGIQAFIDRRFYRRKYDAAKTVAAFSATLRSEVDLNQLRDHLLAVVHETVQPEHASLWLNTAQTPRAPAPDAYLSREFVAHQRS